MADQIPKFLVAHDGADSSRRFVLHTQNPRFLMEIGPGADDDTTWIDAPPVTEQMRGLKDQAREFFKAEK